MTAQPKVSPPCFVRDETGAAYLWVGTQFRPPFKRVPRAWRITPRPPGWHEPKQECLRTVRSKGSVALGDAIAHLALAWHFDGAPSIGSASTSGATDFYAHQFRPLLRYLESEERRILIADEVGLGKTIEAGYILREETSRSRIGRALVVCPRHLVAKWRRELWTRFGLAFDHLEPRTVFEKLAGSEAFYGIVSVDAARGRGKLLDEILDDPTKRLDIVVIDEIHHGIGRGGDTMRRRFLLALSLMSERLVALSATPVQLEEDDLARVLEIVAPHRFDAGAARSAVAAHAALGEACLAIAEARDASAVARRLEEPALVQAIGPAALSQVRSSVAEGPDAARVALARLSPLQPWMTRTRKREVGLDIPRRVRTERVPLSQEGPELPLDGRPTIVSEAWLYRSIDEFLARHFSFSHRLQLASSIHGALPILLHGKQGYARWANDVDAERNVLVGDAEESWQPELDANAREACERWWRASRLVAADSKWARLEEILRELSQGRPDRKIVVFTQWRSTLRHFQARAAGLEGWRAHFLSGDDDDRAREHVIRSFSTEKGRAILATTDVLAEGLDVVAADVVVNYDLPYNPQRVEQRIGRIDRIGQRAREVTVVNLVTQGTIEEDIHDKILGRIRAFERAVGVTADTLIERIENPARLKVEDIDRIQRERSTRAALLATPFEGVDDYLDQVIRAQRGPTDPATIAGLRVALAHFGALLSRAETAAPAEQRSAIATGAVRAGDDPEPLLELLGAQPAPDVEHDARLAAKHGITLGAKGDGVRLFRGHALLEKMLEAVRPTLAPSALPTRASVPAKRSAPDALHVEEATLRVQGRTTKRRTYVIADAQGAREIGENEAFAILAASMEADAPHDAAGATAANEAHSEIEACARTASEAWASRERAILSNRHAALLRSEYGRLKRRVSADAQAAQDAEMRLNEIGAALDALRQAPPPAELSRTPLYHITFTRSEP